MFGQPYGEFVQGSALRTWNCVVHFANLLWYKFVHLRDPIMPRSRRRHHSRSRSRSRTHSHDRDREPKRRKIENYDSPHHRRSVSSEPEAIEIAQDETDSPQSPQSHEVTKRDEETRSDKDNKESKSELIKSSVSSVDESELDTTTTQSTKDDSQLLEESEDEDKNESIAVEDDSDNIDEDPLEESIRNNTPNKIKDKAEDLKITPNKILSPKQLQRKLESEKKRQEIQKEKEENMRKKMQMREERERQKIEEKKRMTEEKKKVIEEKMRLKQEKEEQRTKEKLAKQEEKDKRRREKEEKEELKKKEREQEKLKKQQELDEKNKEKQKLQEQKQKTAAAFVNFFVTKKSDPSEDKRFEDSSKFMPFEIKSDMRLAPLVRKSFKSPEDKAEFEHKLNHDDDCKLYLEQLRDNPDFGRSGRTWPSDETNLDDDVVIVDENVGESIVDQKSKVEKMRAKFFKFHENQRPPYFGTWKKKSKIVSARKPFGKEAIFNYDIDSDEEWEEEGEGESLKGTDDEDEKENESENEYEVDNDVFVPHAYLSDDEINDEEDAKLSPSAHKAKLKLLKNEFDEEMKSKTHKIKPRVIGCIWYDKDKSNVEDVIDKYLQPFSIICDGQIQIKKRSDFALSNPRKAPKLLSKEHVPIFLKLIHGSVDRRKNIVKNFIESMSNNGVQLEVSQMSLGKQFKTFAQWQKCPEEGVMRNKLCWYVGEDIRKEYNVNLTLPNQVKTRQRKTNNK